MRESLYLFESVINSRWFLRTSVILFLNKIDVFKRKLPKVLLFLLLFDRVADSTPQIPLGRYFPEYAGGNDLQKAAKYILWKFMQENRAKLTVYPQYVYTSSPHFVLLTNLCIAQRNASDQHEEHPPCVRRRQGDDPAERAQGLGHPIALAGVPPSSMPTLRRDGRFKATNQA
jgi:hypothetical protein